MKSRYNFLRILQWNAGGLTQAKRTNLLKILNDQRVDVFTIMEANKMNTDMTKFPFPGYNVFVLEKGRKIASGILVGVRDTITSSFQVVKSMGVSEDKIEIAKLDCWLNNCHFKIYCVYNPPNNKPGLDLIVTGKKTILIGDFNAHSKKWGYSDRNPAGDAVVDFLCANNLELVFDKQDPSTFLHYNGSSSNPDLLMVSTDISGDVHRTVLEDCGSGHRVVLAEVLLPRRRVFRPCSKISWNFRKANWTGFAAYLEYNLDENNINFAQHPDKIISDINDIIIKAAKLYIPRGKLKIYRCFWNDRLTELKKNRDELRDRAQETGDPQTIRDWRKSAAILTREINQAKRSAFEDFISKINYKTESLRTYKFMNKVCAKESKTIKESMEWNNRILCNDDQVADAFARHISSKQKKSVFMKEKDRVFKRYNILTRSLDDSASEMCNTNFTEFELELAISQMKKGKSPGPDNIFPEFILHTGAKARKTILKIFNIIWNGRDTVPTLWKKATIIPLLKKDKPASDFNSYRPISLTCTMAKLMERLVIGRLRWHLETKGLLHPAQAGFRRNRSTEEQVAIFSQSIKDNLDKGKIVGAIFVDFKGAYDTVWKLKLLHKLAIKHISGNMLRWFSDFLTKRLINVRYGGAHSSFRALQTGLPQGAVSSCLLFDVYVDDLISSLMEEENINALMYADDLVLWTSSPKYRATERLQVSLNSAMSRLRSWCVENNMIVNTGKTTYQTFSLCHQPLQLNICYDNTTLPTSENTKYLGVVFDRKLTWKMFIDEIQQKTEKRMLLLKRLAGVKWGCATSTLNATYRTFVKPVMTYCCALLITVSQESLDRLQRVQNNALRLITGAVRSTPIEALLLHTNEISMEYEIKRSALKLYYKLSILPHCESLIQSCRVPRKLKTQDGFLQAVLRVIEELGVPFWVEPILPPLNPLDSEKCMFHLDLLYQVGKTNDCTATLFNAGMETIHVRFPPETWLHIYTDGSKLEMDGSVGAGIFSEHFSHYLSVGIANSAFDGEVEAIKVALAHLGACPPLNEQAVIFSDSQAAILAIANCLRAPGSMSALQCRHLMRELGEKYKSVTLQWIPSHCGIPGNEKADELAKKGCKINQVNCHPISYKSAAAKINYVITKTHTSLIKDRTRDKSWANAFKSLPDHPRRSAVAAFRLTTGHDCLYEHLHKINIVNDPACPLCSVGAAMNADHLPICSALRSTSLASRYWEARDLLYRITN